MISMSDTRRYPQRPILGVGALIFDDADRILLVERGNKPLAGYWSLPGGVLEIGETLEEGVVREVREETGLIVKPLRMIEVFERILRDDRGVPEYHYVLIDYVCAVESGELRAADDASSAAWVARGDLSGLQITSGTQQVIEKAFGDRDGHSFESLRHSRA